MHIDKTCPQTNHNKLQKQSNSLITCFLLTNLLHIVSESWRERWVGNLWVETRYEQLAVLIVLPKSPKINSDISVPNRKMYICLLCESAYHVQSVLFLQYIFHPHIISFTFVYFRHQLSLSLYIHTHTHTLLHTCMLKEQIRLYKYTNVQTKLPRSSN